MGGPLRLLVSTDAVKVRHSWRVSGLGTLWQGYQAQGQKRETEKGRPWTS